jgi:uncharacterized protein (DUF1778 family)
MPKAPKPDEKPVPSEPEPTDTVTFSLRLTEGQRDLLTKAAELRGWKPTNLLRIAGLDRAAHIVNTSTLTRVDFRGLARTVADQIFAERSCHLLNEDDQLEQAAAFESQSDIPPYWDSTRRRPVIVSILNRPYSFLDFLKNGALFGGAEFLNLIIQSCEEISRRAQGDLPPPVDPTSL